MWYTSKCNTRRGSRDHAARPRKSRVGLERLEDRAVPATFTVNSLADILTPPAGVVTLRSAIQAANNTAGPNTIDLSVAGTYQITSVGTATNNTAGELAITRTSNLSIVNTSGGSVAVDGGGLNRDFDINPAGSATPFSVTFQGLTITGGSASPGDGADGSGGGIRAQGGASVVLTNVVLTNNTATADGGGIAMESPGNNATGTLTLNNSQVLRNFAGDAGGGIESDGTGLITVGPGCVISGNNCVNQGAGIWLDAGGASLNVKQAVISSNTAGMLAGGIGNAGAGNVTIDASTIEDNYTGGTGGGFGDAANTANLTVLNSVFLDNTAVGNGGGIQEGGPSTYLHGDIFQGNLSEGNGGAVFLSGKNASVGNTRFTQNVAVNGAAIEDTAGSFALTVSTLDHNHTLATNGGTGGSGGGLDVSTGAGSAVVASTYFLANAAGNGGMATGGAINQSAGALAIYYSMFTGNSADIGGAVSFSGTTGTVIDSTFNANRSGIGGGALYFLGTGTGTHGSTLTNDTFTGNVSGGAGGAILAKAPGALTLINDTINGNVSVLGGGVAQFGTGPISFENTIVALDAGGAAPDVFTATNHPVTDLGGNLIGSLAYSKGFGNGTLTGNPGLGPLQNNGGPTAGVGTLSLVVQTEALVQGSRAIDKGVLAGAPKADERGAVRPKSGNTNPSIGAYEPQ